MGTRDLKYLAARLRERATKGTPLSEDDERYLAAVKDFTLLSDHDTATALDAIARARRAAGQWAERQTKGTNASVRVRTQRVDEWHRLAQDYLRPRLRAHKHASPTARRQSTLDLAELAKDFIDLHHAVPKYRTVRDYVARLLATDPADW